MRSAIIYITLLGGLGSLTTKAVTDSTLIQFTGRITNTYNNPLPFAHILVLNSNRGTITDTTGIFTFVVQEKDSILFSTVGYKHKTLVIPDTLAEPFLTLEIKLEMDTIMIAEVEIYPWKNYEEFRRALINLELPDDDMERARRNIAIIKTQIILDSAPNQKENFNYIMNQQYQETFTRGTYPSYQIFNAIAWAKFFQALKNGEFKQDK